MSMAETALNILWLWPDILNLHGDRGNVMALTRISELYGIKTNITRITRLTDLFDPGSADIILLGAGELAVMPEIAGALSKRYDSLKAFSESGGIIFATGTTGAALGVHTTRSDGSHIYGAGLLEMECKERGSVIGDDLIFNPGSSLNTGTDTPVLGIQIQMIDLYLSENQKPLGDIVYGFGNCGALSEGAVNNGVILTNAVGPVLIKNPWLTLALIRKALFGKNPAMDPDALRFDPSLFEIELASAAAIQAFNDKKEKPR